MKIYANFLLKYFSFYLIVGNLLRFVDFGFFNYVSLTEMILYAISFFAFFAFGPMNLFVLLSSLIISAFMLLGIYLNGVHFGPLVHGIRLIAMICSGVAIGKALYIKFGFAIDKMQGYLESIYIKLLTIGFLIYWFFPDSRELWLLLSNYGIEFHGDPHYSRFVSTYFDPNFFSAICCIPFVLSWSMYRRAPSYRQIAKITLFALAIFLSWSRSGIATFILVAGYAFSQQIPRHLKVKRLGFVLLLFCLFCLFSEEGKLFVYRLTHIKSDASAFARLMTLFMGLDIFVERPLTGIGYNYLFERLEGRTPNGGIDSSLLLIFVDFGIVVGIALLLSFLCWMIASLQKVESIKSHDRDAYLLFRMMMFYLCACVLFTCHFNNLLFYPFWLIPILAFFSYYDCYLKAAISSGVYSRA